MFSILEKINNLLIKKLMIVLGTDKYGVESREKVYYTLKVLLNEFEKVFILLLIFFLMGYEEEFLIILATIGLIRSFLGGIHMKTTIGCMFFTYVFIGTIITLAENFSIARHGRELIYGMLCFVIYFFEPMSYGGNNIKHTKVKKVKFKLNAITILFVISRIIEKVPMRTGNIMLIALFMQSTEVIIVRILNIRRVE